MLCSKLYCQKGFALFLFLCEIGLTNLARPGSEVDGFVSRTQHVDLAMISSAST